MEMVSYELEFIGFAFVIVSAIVLWQWARGEVFGAEQAIFWGFLAIWVVAALGASVWMAVWLFRKIAPIVL